VAVKLAICQGHPRQHGPLTYCMQGRVREVVIYFKFHENRLRGLRAVEGRKSPSPIDLLAHGLYNSLCNRTSCDDNRRFVDAAHSDVIFSSHINSGHVCVGLSIAVKKS